MNHPEVLKTALPVENIPDCGAAYLVGGTVRDLLLSRSPADYDIVVVGNPEDFARQLATGNHGRVVILGKPGLLLYRVVIPGGLIDVTGICGESIEADLGERDFAINAMALDLATGQVIDLFEGRRDIERRVVRMVSADAFVRDPVRLIRAYRMAAAFSFTISKDTTDAIAEHARRIRASAPERVRDELMKILKCAESVDIVRQMEEAGLLREILPELTGSSNQMDRLLDMYGGLEQILCHPEKRFPKWAEDIRGDIGNAAGTLLKCCSLFTAIESTPGISTPAAGRALSQRHANERADVAAGIAGRLKFSNYQTQFIDTIIRYAPQIRRCCRTGMTRREHMRFFTRCDAFVPSMLLLESAVDENAMAGADGVLEEFYGVYRPIARMAPLIGGRDLMAELALDPSPLFARILSAVSEERLMGNLTHRDEAIEFVRQWLARDTG